MKRTRGKEKNRIRPINLKMPGSKSVDRDVRRIHRIMEVKGYMLRAALHAFCIVQNIKYLTLKNYIPLQY